MESAVGLRWAYSNKRQVSYVAALANGDLDQSHPFEGVDIGDHVVNMADNAALYGKGHEFATREYLLSWDTRFRRASFLTTKLAGWGFAFHTGVDSVSPLDVGPPAAYRHVFEYMDPFGTGYYGSGRQLPVTTIAEQVTSNLVRKFPSMLVSAIELTGSLNDFCRIAMDLVGSGVMERVDAVTAAATSATFSFGSGANGVVTTTVTATGTAGNSFTMKVELGTGNNVPLSAALVGTAITVTLATDGTGANDPAANTATLVAAAIDALAQVTSVASGTGAGVITSIFGPSAFTGGAAATTQAITWPTGAAAQEGERLRNTAMLFEQGPTGLLVDTSCDIRSWRFRSEYSLADADGYCPGSGYLTPGNPLSGQVRNKLEFLRRAVLLEFVVRASRDNTLFTRLEGLVDLAAQITLTGADINTVDPHQVKIEIPTMNYRAIAIGADGDVITYSVSTVIRYDDGLANPYQVTVDNDIPTYLTT